MLIFHTAYVTQVCAHDRTHPLNPQVDIAGYEDELRISAPDDTMDYCYTTWQRTL